MSLKEYKPGTTFTGRMGRTVSESDPAWPAPVRSTPGAPNVLYIVLDDTGYGQFGCYGSPINTPNLDRLAQNGLRYTNMHTTALCSPSRSCMLTGRNHHSNGMACITEGSTGYPGSNGAIPFQNGFLSEMLLPHGYATFCVGKWHLTPAEQISAAGPYDRWPLGRGFDRYYGFLGGDTHQYYPDLVFDNHQVEPPKTPDEGYHLSADLADKAIEFVADLKQVAPDKPFFLYFATGANHAPHQVPKEWADKYAGQFDDGWDAYREKVFARQKELGIVAADAELSRHDPDVQQWAELSDDERRLYARMMEVFAGFFTYTDHQIGRAARLPRASRSARQHADHGDLGQRRERRGRAARLGQREQVLQQRARRPRSRTSTRWTTSAGRSTSTTIRGGGPSQVTPRSGDGSARRIAAACPTAFLVHWPKGIKAKGENRDQYAHAIDMVPTVLESLGIEAPTEIRGVAQSPIEGVSFAHSFDDAACEDQPPHPVLRDVRPPRRSITTAGVRCARSPAPRSPRRE